MSASSETRAVLPASLERFAVVASLIERMPSPIQPHGVFIE
jgi:hypothetical protein